VGTSGSATSASALGLSGGTRAAAIPDPSLNNLTAFQVTIPAKWDFQGVLYQAGTCVPIPAGVFRSSSPDGLSYAEAMPSLGWVYFSGPTPAQAPKDCIPVKGPMTAQQFLQYLAASMKLTYGSDVAVPADVNAAAQNQLATSDAKVAGQYAAAHMTPPKNTRELARANVSYQNGTFAMAGQLRVQVDCSQTQQPALGNIPAVAYNRCTTTTTYYTAPQNELTAALAAWDAPGMGEQAQNAWSQAWIQRNAQQTQQAIAQMNRQAQQAMAAQAQQFQHNMAVQSAMHQQFLATMQAGTDASMARANASMNAQSTAASDMVDYALDQQTVLDPNTGQISNVPSAGAYTWVNGNTNYQTNDANANPNGVMQGTWTKQVVVHGNGTPY
jgi:hypothetical protein